MESDSTEAAGAEFRANAETPKREESKILVENIFAVSQKAPKEINMTPEHAAKQRAILERLPDNLVDQVRAHLYAEPIEHKQIIEERYHREIKDEEVLRDDTLAIRGLIHEMLVEAEGDLRGSTQVSKEILSALQNPKRHDTEKNTTLGDALRGRRSPDTARAEVKQQGNVVISLTYEAKKASLDLRAAQQLGPYGVIESCEILAETLNRADADELRELGFPALAEAREHFDELVERGEIKLNQERRLPDFVSVSPNFFQVVAVPAEKNVADPTKLVARDVTGTDRKEFMDLLKNPDRVKFIRSAFSTSQENAMADFIRDRIYEIEKDNPKFQTKFSPPSRR